jgi:hypothetical protein
MAPVAKPDKTYRTRILVKLLVNKANRVEKVPARRVAATMTCLGDSLGTNGIRQPTGEQHDEHIAYLKGRDNDSDLRGTEGELFDE